MRRRIKRKTMQPLRERNDVMLSDQTRLANDRVEGLAGEKLPAEAPDHEDDWLSDWRPPGLQALSLLLLAGELGLSVRRKPN